MIWQDIITAPKDGTRVLFYGNLADGEDAYGIFSWLPFFSGTNKCKWLGSAADAMSDYNVIWTHWMPLPKPPEQEKQKGLDHAKTDKRL